MFCIGPQKKTKPILLTFIVEKSWLGMKEKLFITKNWVLE